MENSGCWVWFVVVGALFLVWQSWKADHGQDNWLTETYGQDNIAAYDQGMEYLERGLYHKARESFDKSLRGIAFMSRSQQAQALIGRGRAYSGLRNFDLAVEDFDKAIKRKPDEHITKTAYYHRGNALKHLSSQR